MVVTTVIIITTAIIVQIVNAGSERKLLGLPSKTAPFASAVVDFLRDRTCLTALSIHVFMF